RSSVPEVLLTSPPHLPLKLAKARTPLRSVAACERVITSLALASVTLPVGFAKAFFVASTRAAGSSELQPTTARAEETRAKLPKARRVFMGSSRVLAVFVRAVPGKGRARRGSRRCPRRRGIESKECEPVSTAASRPERLRRAGQAEPPARRCTSGR